MTTKTQERKLTVSDILWVRENDSRWLGWGYIGERDREESVSKQHIADGAVLKFANAEGWNYDQLFEWCNSKPGRHFGDMAFGCTPDNGGRWSMKTLEAEGRRCGLLYDVLAEAEAAGWT